MVFVLPVTPVVVGLVVVVVVIVVVVVVVGTENMISVKCVLSKQYSTCTKVNQSAKGTKMTYCFRND